MTGAIGGAGGIIVRGLTSTGTKAVVQGAVSAISTGARDVAENAFFGGNKSSTDIWANMGISFVTSAGISYLGDTLISKMNAAKANSGVQACKKAEVDYSERNNSLEFNYQKETKAGFQVKSSEVVEYWNEYLGDNQTNVNPYNGVVDKDRIFSEDGLRSIRFGTHEMNKIGTTKFHFHQENWNYNSTTGKIDISNTLIRIK